MERRVIRPFLAVAAVFWLVATLVTMRWGVSRLVAEFAESAVAIAVQAIVLFAPFAIAYYSVERLRLRSERAQIALGIFLWAASAIVLIALARALPGIGWRLAFV